MKSHKLFPFAKMVEKVGGIPIYVSLMSQDKGNTKCKPRMYVGVY